MSNELTLLNETDLAQVEGGILPLIAIAYVGIALSGTVLVAGAGVVAGMKAYAATH